MFSLITPKSTPRKSNRPIANLVILIMKLGKPPVLHLIDRRHTDWFLWPSGMVEKMMVWSWKVSHSHVLISTMFPKVRQCAEGKLYEVRRIPYYTNAFYSKWVNQLLMSSKRWRHGIDIFLFNLWTDIRYRRSRSSKRRIQNLISHRPKSHSLQKYLGGCQKFRFHIGSICEFIMCMHSIIPSRYLLLIYTCAQIKQNEKQITKTGRTTSKSDQKLLL